MAEDKNECEKCGTTKGDIQKVSVLRISTEHGQPYWSTPHKYCRSCRGREGEYKLCG